MAIIVNDMGAVNIDAALLQNGGSLKQREESMVELSNGCICCTLREDLLQEVAKLAAEQRRRSHGKAAIVGTINGLTTNIKISRKSSGLLTHCKSGVSNFKYSLQKLN